MFSIILFLLQIFVPYSEPDLYESPEVDKVAFDQILATNQSIIAFVVEKTYKEMIPVIKSMNEVASFFSEKAKFLFLDHDLGTQFAYMNKLSLPCFFFFKDGKFVSAYSYPKVESAFVKIVQSLVDPLEISTKDELMNYLGDCYYTILALPELYSDALSIFKDNYIECDIVCVNKDLLDKLELDDNRLALYRQEDSMIVSFSNFSNAKIPYYQVLTYHALFDEDKPIFGISAKSFTNEMKEFLYDLSDEYPDFIYGFITEDYHRYFNITLGVEVNDPNENLDALFFNSKHRYHYDVSDIFTKEFLSKPFEIHTWTKHAKTILDSLRSNERKKIYLSAPVPIQNSQDPVQTVVGKTYEEFVNQKDKDVIILFVREGCDICAKFNVTLHSLHAVTSNASMTNLSYGIIDITNNSGDFPYFTRVPHLVIYPANNKTNPVPLRGNKGFDNLIWFIKRYGSYDCPIPFEKMTPSQFEMDYVQQIREVMEMPQEERRKFYEWAYEMAEITDTDIRSFRSVRSRHNKFEPGFEHEMFDDDHHHHHDHDHHHDQEVYTDYNEL